MNSKQKTFLFCTLLVVFAVVTRILSIENQWYNFTSIGAIALFSGRVFKNKSFAFSLPLIALLVTDFYLHKKDGSGFYDVSQYFVYGSLVLIALLGTFMKKINTLNVLGFAIGSSLIFYIVSNFGVWFSGFFTNSSFPAMYTLDFKGLILCLEAGLPFYKNTFASDVLFSGVLFGAYALFQSVTNKKVAIA